MSEVDAPREKDTGSRPRHANIAEARRRAAIVKRYVAIERPDVEIDDAFAAEIGLSVDSLIRMATAWRRLGEAKFLQGSGYRPSELDRIEALEALERGVDLDEVPASRRPEIRKRLRAIRQYLRIEQPDSTDVSKAADRLGMTSHQFRKMVRIWIMFRSAVAVPGAYAAKRPRRKNTQTTDMIAMFIRRALEELGDDARGDAVHARTVELCGEAGIRPPALSTTYERLRSLRSKERARGEGGMTPI
ncbi:hypothetical protein [Sphingomonas oryzagri]|uniref:Uncharacterized protein n=1 Tax=Sphingomonas oryzagri TaxID=3042314 RepID=A0ABT6N3S5_9SPHN|nr:hypothetical protein [Sphingomonas oryzagri]MDH7639960.1 hypothetical protein [Sphingomonas oryzagri]